MATTSSGVALGPILDATGLPTPDRNSRWAPSSWRVRSPTQSMWAEQSYQLAGQGVPAGQRLLVAEDQRLVAGAEVDLVQPGLGLEVDAAGPHEAQGPVDLVGDGLVALALAAELATNCWFQVCTWLRSAKPPLVKARSRFRVDADWW